MRYDRQDVPVQARGRWISISDGDLGLMASGPIWRGTMVIELRLPDGGPSVLLAHRTATGEALSLVHDADDGLSLRLRTLSGPAEIRLPGPFRATDAIARLEFHWNAASPGWRITLRCEGEVWRKTGDAGVALSVELAQALCTTPALRRPEILWTGFAEGMPPRLAGSWIGIGATIATPRGPVRGGDLRPGDLVLTGQGDARPVTRIDRTAWPTRGRFAPVRLRAPFFGATEDIVLSHDARLVTSGVDVEYLFSEEEVATRAGDLVNGRYAHWETRRPVINFIAIHLGAEETLFANGCLIASSDAEAATPLWRTLARYEAVTLLAQRGAGRFRSVALG